MVQHRRLRIQRQRRICIYNRKKKRHNSTKNGKNVYPQEIEFLINKIPYIAESLVYSRDKDTTDTMLCAKIVYDKDAIKQMIGEKTEEEYKEIIWQEIKKINQELPIFKKIKNITITTEPLKKTTTQKVKRYEELKKLNLRCFSWPDSKTPSQKRKNKN